VTDVVLATALAIMAVCAVVNVCCAIFFRREWLRTRQVRVNLEIDLARINHPSHKEQ
jgi:hypothetical protein